MIANRYYIKQYRGQPINPNWPIFVSWFVWVSYWHFDVGTGDFLSYSYTDTRETLRRIAERFKACQVTKKENFVCSFSLSKISSLSRPNHFRLPSSIDTKERRDKADVLREIRKLAFRGMFEIKSNEVTQRRRKRRFARWNVLSAMRVCRRRYCANSKSWW